MSSTAPTAAPHAPKSNTMRRRWSRIREFAKAARADRQLFLASAVLAVVYNLVGALDIISTVAGLQAQLGEEANPFVRLLMDNLANGWILAKLGLQLLVTVMILWFPHRLVLMIFTVPVAVTAMVVWNNLQIAGMF